MTANAPGADAPYEVLAPLAGGTYGENLVALRRDRLGVGKLVVLRQLRRSLSADAGARGAFVEAGRRAVRLSHPNVVTTFELGERGGALVAVTEYVEGETLDAITAAVVGAKNAVDTRLWLLILCEALAGLHYAHELADFDGSALRIVHGGITPRRIFVAYTGRVFLTDFGLATLAPHAKRLEGTYLPEMIGYASPEQRAGIPTDRRSDVFAMGVLAWELLSGQKHLAPADLTLEMEPLPNLKELKEGIDPKLAAAVARAVALDPAARWETAAEFRRALEPHVDLGLLRRGAIGDSIAALFAKTRDKIPSLLSRRLGRIEEQGPLSLALRPSDAPPADDSGEGEDGEEEAFLLASPIEAIGEENVISVRELVSESELLESGSPLSGASAEVLSSDLLPASTDAVPAGATAAAETSDEADADKKAAGDAAPAPAPSKPADGALVPAVASSVELIVDFGSGQLPDAKRDESGKKLPASAESAPAMTVRSPNEDVRTSQAPQMSVAPSTEVSPPQLADLLGDDDDEEADLDAGDRPTLTSTARVAGAAAEPAKSGDEAAPKGDAPSDGAKPDPEKSDASP